MIFTWTVASKIRGMVWRLVPVLFLLASCAAPAVRPVGRSASPGTVEFRNLSAGPFRAEYWERGTLHFLPDARSPLIEPRPGAYRNIYAPSVVGLPDGSFRVFFGGWDGTPTGNDQIWSLDASADFLALSAHRLVIAHGPFQHVCNVSAVRNPADGSYTLMCTAYPDARGLNKPAAFRVPADLATRPATTSDVIEVDGYPNYAAGDLNGVNPILPDEDGRTVRLYFANFRDFGHIYRASPADGKRFTFEGKVLDFAGMPNDAKRLGRYTLLAFHQNGPALFYSVSPDPLHFPPPRELGRNGSDADRYIVAVGLVCRGETVLGYLYGAGAASSLDRNRIYARWLQRKVIFVTEDGRRVSPAQALGPDRAVLDLATATRGRVEVYAEDGVTPVRVSAEVTLVPGEAYAVRR